MEARTLRVTPKIECMPDAAFAPSSTFASFFMGGFECSTHLRKRNDRLDLIAATHHDITAAGDYAQLQALGLRTVRDGMRWHLIERSEGRYDWSSFLGMLRAANASGIQVIWDLFHYGWPDGLDIFDPRFIDRFGAFAAAAASVIRQESDNIPFYCPVNEISYFAWAGGAKRLMSPFHTDRAAALKQQLVRASIAAIEAVRAVDPRARIVHAEPIIHVEPTSERDSGSAEAFRTSQFEAMDMLSGRLHPELGGRPAYLDILGVNFYPDNQWFLNGNTIPLGHHRYRPLSQLLQEISRRYERPLVITETGAEGSARCAWLYYVVREVLSALSSGVEVEGLCLYPVTDYPGWMDGRLCETGLLGVATPAGSRRLHGPLATELIASATLLRRQLSG
jgi:beta-glucosidase/6-phospho-beta-glucosidase/beta-galactosidase